MARSPVQFTVMDVRPRYNFIDILWAPARALSAKQIFVMTLFLVVGFLWYDLFAYLAYAIDGEDLSAVQSAYGLFPLEQFIFHGPIAQGVFGIGLIGAALLVMLGFLGVAIINIESVRGNRFLSARAAIRFAVDRFKQIFLAELAIAAFVLFIVGLFALLGLVTRIPLLGDWLFVLLFAIPNFIIALFSVFIVFVFTLTFLLLPAVAAADRHGEAFTAILETFSTLIRQPFRWGVYTAYSFVAAKVCGFIFAYFCFRAVQFLVWSSSLGGGDDLRRLVLSGLAHLPVEHRLVGQVCKVFPGVPFSFSINPWLRGSGESAISYAMAAMLFLIFCTVIGYMLAVVAAAQARGYVVLRSIKDSHRIGDEKPLFGEGDGVPAEERLK